MLTSVIVLRTASGDYVVATVRSNLVLRTMVVGVVQQWATLVYAARIWSSPSLQQVSGVNVPVCKAGCSAWTAEVRHPASLDFPPMPECWTARAQHTP